MADIDYTPIQNTMLYAKYSRGYRTGGVATFVADGYHLFGPEHVNTFELDEKSTFGGHIPGTFDVGPLQCLLRPTVTGWFHWPERAGNQRNCQRRQVSHLGSRGRVDARAN
jgi:hypothetical protein